MKVYRPLLVFCAFLAIQACNKDSDQSGCTDPIAVNYDPSALREDGSCLYSQAEQVIWSDGVRGGWNGDAISGAFRLELCRGEVEEMVFFPEPDFSADSLHADTLGGDTLATDTLAADTAEVELPDPEYALRLSTGGEESHHSFFRLINEQNARDFVNGSLRFDCKAMTDGTPEFIRIFLTGKVQGDASCGDYWRSEYVEISTHSFNDSTYTPVTIPILNFGQLMLARVQVVCGFEFEGERYTGVDINRLRWSANLDAD